jgi:bifunctional non-homologous end joining protein LigD
MAAQKDTLLRYRQKRDFSKTPEPEGAISARQNYRYLIQKHAASHLHYDFRLELDGTLKSWAVPRGPSLDPRDKRLAMQVEDHPVAYGDFEGIIPKGEYGGGTVMLWDEGSWEPVGDPHEGLEKGKLVFKLHGKRLKGEWTLVKSFSREKRGNSWLLIKHKDEEVREGGNAEFLEENSSSVASGRTMEEIAEGAKVWHSNKISGKANGKTSGVTKKVKASPKPSKLPEFTYPQLATLATTMPEGKNWVHEIKFDGYRMVAYIENGQATIYSRSGKDWTEEFKTIAERLAKFAVDNAIIDGELVVVDAEGKSNFMELKYALSNGETDRFQYYAFDIIYINGRDISDLPLIERKEILAGIISKNAPAVKAQRIFFSEHFNDKNFLQKLCGMELEGAISKRADAPYHKGRSKTWLKTKCQKRQEFVIGGFTLSSTGGAGIGALLLGYYDEGKLKYAGRVGTGFTNEVSANLRKMLEKLRQKTNPFIAISTEGRRGAIWVKPQLVGEVEFSEWTPDGSLRHPSFKGLREDKPAKEIMKEKAVSLKSIAKEIEVEVKEKPVKAATPDKKSVLVGDIKISHPARVIYPGTDITKQELAEYYLEAADYILPYIVNRPISMVRCPEGAGEPCFFQRHVGLGKSPHLHEVSVEVKGESRDYLMIRDPDGLISLIQWGVIEIHPWQCAADNLEKPDRIVFDLDPDPDVTFAQLIEGAKEVRGRMEELGLQTFLKTTGGKGLHVVAPITPTYGFAAIKSFTRAIAESMENDNPDLYIANMSKAKRKGRIFVDYLRNEVTATAVAPYSARAREGATVSLPIAWEELKASLNPADFTIESVPTRLKRQKKDPWGDFGKVKQKIAAKYLKALKIEPE